MTDRCALPPCWSDHEAALFFGGYFLCAAVVAVILITIARTK